MSKAVDRLFKTVMNKYRDEGWEPPKALMDRPLQTEFPALSPEPIEPMSMDAMMQVPVVTDMSQLAGLGQLAGGMAPQLTQQAPMGGPMAPQPAVPQRPQANPRGVPPEEL